ncbi:tetratricopeptide repeat protein [Ornithinimicrobium pratense]|uniref:Tetratricopeptide repeat protein n=1 Tax=Ornithinimicrobium pratense TaxID=2593973 RepID=A0A5J6V1W7_9MICO|nr:tetratricopeptide repeat protein [Ornithinimicrobium pratense]QFG67850.1 tetratricopeptide repeat protein [Ornithinimicrobium pratense]
MTQQPFSPAALRGAVDLSGLGARPRGGTQQPPSAASAQGSGPAETGAVPGRQGALVTMDDSSFESVVTASLTAPVVLVLWSPQAPESAQHLRELVDAARSSGGRFQVAAADLAASPGIMQALTPLLQQAFGQVSSLPVVIGLLGGQPMPFYVGVQPMAQVDQLLTKFLEAAVANGVTGRVEVGAADAPVDEAGEEGELPPLHQAAYDAIDRGDWAAAITAYEQALEQDPSDEMARLGLGQVRLLERTSTLDLAAVRARAAADPTDVSAQIEAADVDVVGGHVEDGFARLVDTVRRTSDKDRDAARTHLLSLFEVVGPQDPRVQKARSALMSALF